MRAGLATAEEFGNAMSLVSLVQPLVSLPVPVFGWQEWLDFWLQFFLHFVSLSLLSVGGALTTAPEMHRFLVDRQGWLSHTQFNASIALAQAAPGPNVLFVALIGWNIGLNAGGWWTALAGVGLSMLGILLPSTLLTYNAARWSHRNRHLRVVRAFKQGMAPVVVALLMATGWILASTSSAETATPWKVLALSTAAALVVWRSKIHVLWLLAAGALLGWFGWV